MAEASLSQDFYTIVEDGGAYQIRASIKSPEQMGELVEKLKEIHLKIAVAFARASKEKTHE